MKQKKKQDLSWRKRDNLPLIRENEHLKKACRELRAELEKQKQIEIRYGKRCAEYEKRLLNSPDHRKEPSTTGNQEITLAIGTEPEFFENEAAALLLDALREYVRNAEPDRRRTHILQSILDANPDYGLQERKHQLKQLMKDYRGMDGEKKKGLNQLGFEVQTSEGKLQKHYKILYHGDPRYTAVTAASGSDYRGGLNIASVLNKLAL